MPNNLPYRVVWARKAIEALKELGRKAHESGSGKELARVVRTVDERLRREPTTFGEVYRVRGPVGEYLAVHEFVAIDFAVDQQRQFVLVRDCRSLSGLGA